MQASSFNFVKTQGEFKELFLIATSKTHFVFKDSFYDPIDGVAMGSPLGPILANLTSSCMGHHERVWLDDYHDSAVSYFIVSQCTSPWTNLTNP